MGEEHKRFCEKRVSMSLLEPILQHSIYFSPSKRTDHQSSLEEFENFKKKKERKEKTW